jgi:hypothetical protein
MRVRKIKMLYITSNLNHLNWAKTPMASAIPVPVKQWALMDTVIKLRVSQTLQRVSTSAQTIIF